MAPNPHCSSCGFDNPPGMKFCGNCGTRLSDTATTATVTPIQKEIPATEFTDIEAVPRQLGAMVGADLLERFRKAGLEAAGQRRNVTVLFADLTGYTSLSTRVDSEDLYELIQKYTGILANAVYKYEGMVDKFTGDGLMALFGAPIAHENNAELAILAALEMLAEVSKLSEEMKSRLGSELQVHIGLHTGSVIVGGIGSDMLMNYTAIGDTVNLSQRLDAIAEGGTILVSEAVYQKTKALFDFDVVENLKIKGYTHTITGYRVSKVKSKPGSTHGLEGIHAPMIGRDSELRRLTQVTGALVAYQQGQFVLIIGDAGLGKSRLVAEVKTLSARLAVTILEAFSLTYRRTVSYWLFLDLLRSYLKVTSETPVAEVSEILRRQVNMVLGERAGDALPYLEHILSLPHSDPESAHRIEYLEAGQLRQQIFLAVRDLLMAETRNQPLLLILEDLHWADEASLSLLNFLIDSVRQCPLLIVAVSRPYQGGTISKIVERAEHLLSESFSLISLQNLTPGQSMQLLRQLLAVPNLPESLRDQIIQRAAGIPLYLEEILRMLIDSNALLQKDGKWRFVEGIDISTLGVPDTLQGLILTRFDRLNPSQRRVMQVASVIGRTFSLPVLRYVLPTIAEHEAREVLVSLIEREFILPQVASYGFEYTFKHILASDAIYSTLLKRERGELHGQVGEAIETLYADRLDEQVDLLARHYSWSPRKAKALHYLILAGQRAARSYVNDQARLHFEEALALLDQVEHNPRQVVQVRVGLGDILVLAGEYQAAREQYLKSSEAIAGENPANCIELRSELERKKGITYERQGDYDEALEHFADAQEILGDAAAPMPVESAELLNDIGWIHFRRGNVDEAERFLQAALSWSQDTPRYDVTASIYNRLGGVYYQKDQLDQASNYVRKSLVLREELRDTVAVARSYSNLGLLAWRQGEWDRALENFRRSLELHAKLGDVEGAIDLHANIGLLLTDKGELEEARQHLEDVLQNAQRIGHSFLEGMAYHHLSRLWLAAGEWEKSLDYSHKAHKVFTEIGAEENLADLYAAMGEAWLGLGLTAQARQAGEKGLELIEKEEGPGRPPSPAKGRILRLLGNLEKLQGNLEESERLIKESAVINTTLHDQLESGRSLVALAQLAQARGDATAFRLHASEARIVFRQLGAKREIMALEKLGSEAPALIPQ